MKKPSPSTLDFPALFKLLPGGYDPIATAGDSWFDAEKAQLACDFFREHLVHIEGHLGGKPFLLEPWQQAIVGCIFGWQRTDEMKRTVRRYRKVFLYCPRKQGKSPLCAGIGDYILFCDNEPGAQIYLAAADSEQASVLFRHGKGMVEANPMLASRATIYGGVNHRSMVLNADQASVLRVLSSDASTKHGGNSHAILIDELHAQKNRDLVDVLTTSMASSNRAQPIVIFITTADFKRESICNEELDYARKVRDGLIENPNYLPIIYETKDDADWTDPKVWAACNPNLGVSVSLKYLTDECKRAQDTPGYANTFKRLHLNLQTESDVAWLDLAKWDACAATFTEEDLVGRDCYGGLDLSTKIDLTNLTLLFPPIPTGELDIEKSWVLLQYFFVPKENAENREKRDRVPYPRWISEGHITATEGNVVDYAFVKAQVVECLQKFNVLAIGFDPWNATQIAMQLDEESGRSATKEAPGLMIEFRQGFASMSEPSKELEKLLISKAIRHNGNPVMRWMVSNCAVEGDAAGNIKPSKKKSTERIDGVVGAVMSLGLAMTKPVEGPSCYEKGSVI